MGLFSKDIKTMDDLLLHGLHPVGFDMRVHEVVGRLGPLLQSQGGAIELLRIEEGVVSPAHVVVDTFPSEQGSQRVNDAATLYKAKKKSSRSLRRSRSRVPPRARP